MHVVSKLLFADKLSASSFEVFGGSEAFVQLEGHPWSLAVQYLCLRTLANALDVP